MKNKALVNRTNLSNHHFRNHNPNLTNGSLVGKFPVIIDGGKTVIFISDKSKEEETRRNYELRKTLKR